MIPNRSYLNQMPMMTEVNHLKKLKFLTPIIRIFGKKRPYTAAKRVLSVYIS